MPNGESKEVLSVGLACSECFSGPRLAKVLKKGLEYEQKTIEDLMRDDFALPLSIHTSAGVPEPLSQFIETLQLHLPWQNASSLDWVVSLQLEGASAVWAAIDMLLQEQILRTGNFDRKMVAVAEISYHGPPSTSFGSRSPLWHKSHQIKYPVPRAGKPLDEDKLLAEFEAFLDECAPQIGVLLVEPQWGSSQAAFPWPKTLLKAYIMMAQNRGIKVVADEIMCGLARHGQGTLFLSKAWGLNPDAVTFGKAIAAGAYPLSGAIMKTGRDTLATDGRSVMQSHTFAGSHTRALMTAIEVLNDLPAWYPAIEELGQEMDQIFSCLERISDGMIVTHGQGLMWGALFTTEGRNSDHGIRKKCFEVFKKNCSDLGVLPYHVPKGGFMVTPTVDTDVNTVRQIGQKLEEVLLKTMDDVGWKETRIITNVDSQAKAESPSGRDCHQTLHAVRSVH